MLHEAELHALPSEWHFTEFAHADFATSLHPEAIALIRDGDRWSQLVPANFSTADPLTLWSIHFATGINNSGFVGWLAKLIKQHTGSGVAVVCGQNTPRGSIFDYWCAPAPAISAIHTLFAQLRS